MAKSEATILDAAGRDLRVTSADRVIFPETDHAPAITKLDVVEYYLAVEICPTEIALVGWAAQMGTITFHPWPVRREDVDHPDELRLDLDPQPGTDFDDAVRVAGVARELLGELGYAGFPKTSGGRGEIGRG